MEFCYIHTPYLMVYCNIGTGMLWVTWYFSKPVRDKERCKLWGINYSTMILFTSILAFLSIITVFFLLVSMTGKINFQPVEQSFYQLNLQELQITLMVMKVVTWGKFYQLPPEKENSVIMVVPCLPLFCSYHILILFLIYYWTDTHQHGMNLLMRLSHSIHTKTIHLMHTALVLTTIDSSLEVL